MKTGPNPNMNSARASCAAPGLRKNTRLSACRFDSVSATQAVETIPIAVCRSIGTTVTTIATSAS